MLYTAIVATSPQMTQSLYMAFRWAGSLNKLLLSGSFKYVALVFILFGLAKVAYQSLKWGDIGRFVEYFIVCMFILVLCSRWVTSVNMSDIRFLGDPARTAAYLIPPDVAAAAHIPTAAEDVPGVEVVLTALASRINLAMACNVASVMGDAQRMMEHPLLKMRAYATAALATYDIPEDIAVEVNTFLDRCYAPALQDPVNRGKTYPRDLNYGDRKVVITYPDGREKRETCASLYTRLPGEVYDHVQRYVRNKFRTVGGTYLPEALAGLATYVWDIIRELGRGHPVHPKQVFFDNLLLRGNFASSGIRFAKNAVEGAAAFFFPGLSTMAATGAVAVGGALGGGHGAWEAVKGVFGKMIQALRTVGLVLTGAFTEIIILPVVRGASVVIQAFFLAFLVGIFPFIVLLALLPGEWERVVNWFFSILGVFLWSTGWLFVDRLAEVAMSGSIVSTAFYIRAAALSVAYILIPIVISMVMQGAKQIVGDILKGVAAGGSAAGGAAIGMATRGLLGMGGG